jgi:sRNA-binding carbon storage regulator CsrA
MVVITRKELQRTIITTPAGEEITIVNLSDNRMGIEAPEQYGVVTETVSEPRQFELGPAMSFY